MTSRGETKRDHIDLVLSDSCAPGFTYEEIHQRYVDSIYGVHHATQLPRFSQQYGYEPAQMIMDLGDDVHPVRHMLHTESNIAVPFVTTQITEGYYGHQFSSQQVRGLRLAAILHDIGESQHPAIAETVGSIVGDVWFESKQQSDGEQEVLIRQFIYKELYEDVPAELLEQAEEAIEVNESFSGIAFNTIERIGYYKTAIRAGELALKSSNREAENPSERFINLARLALRVSDNHRSILQERSELFPQAGRILRLKASSDERIHAELPELVQVSVGESA